LGYFYYKGKDIFTAKEKLKECVKQCNGLEPRSPIESSARELLNNIWNYQIRPPWWRWWWDSPLNNRHRRITFVILSLFTFALPILHPLIPEWLAPLRVNWTIYVFLIALIIIVLISPSIERIRARDIIEVEMHSPPPFEPILSPAMMEQRLEEIEKYSQPELSA